MNVSRKGIVFAVAAVAVAAVFASALLQVSEVEGTIAGEQLEGRLAAADAAARPVVLDVRTPTEFAAGHVPGAINVPHDEVGARLGELAAAKDRDVVVYCQRGGRAKTAIGALAAAGFTRLHHLAGDMAEWSAAGRRVETGGAAAASGAPGAADDAGQPTPR